MRRRPVFLALTAGALAFASAQPSLGEEIVVRAGFGAPPAAERLLARVAKENRLPVAAGENPLERVRALCGRLTPTYISLLNAANPGIEWKPAAGPREVKVPACFFMAFETEAVTRLADESLTDFSKRVVGASGPKTVQMLHDHNAALSAAAVGRPTKVTVPFTTQPTVYTLKADAPAAEAVADQIAASLGTPVDPTAVASSDPNDLRPMEGVIARKAVSCDSTRPEIELGKWPFDVAALQAALERNRTTRTARGMPPATPVAVAVADNGVDGLTGPDFPSLLLFVNAGETPANNMDDDGNGYPDDINGVNLFLSGPPGPAPVGAVPNRQHGTLIASLALGGPAWLAQLGAPGQQPIHLMPIGMVERRTESIQGANVTRYSYPSKALSAALRYAQNLEVSVMNVSVGTGQILTDFEELARQNANLVIVAAAGNEANDFRFVTLYPASYGGEGDRLPGRIVTVGAHDRRGCLADFSGRGATTVDIVAPGVGITAYSLAQARETLDGTSQSTAFVSFTIGVLKSEGLRNPQAIKDRLYATADRLPELAPYVASGGALNMVKAVSVHHDLLERKPDGAVEFGELVTRPTIADVCVEAAGGAVGRLLRIEYTGGAEPLKVLWRPNGGKRSEMQCTPANGVTGVDFKPQGGSAEKIAWSEIHVLIPR